MDIDVNKENLCINKLVSDKKELFFVEEDMIVPDSKPDILNSINLNGNVCIYKKEIMDGKVKIEGCVNTYIMYLPDSQEDNLRALNASLDFSQIILIPESKAGMDATICVTIKDLECKVLNGRKINVRAGLEAKIKLYSNEEVEFISGINNMQDIQILDKGFTINSLIGNNSTRVYVKDTLNIDIKDEIAEILRTEINLIDNDMKISYNKVISKCEAEVKIMYLTEDNRINTIQGRIPAVGFIDMQNILEENICEVNNEIVNTIIRPNSSEEHSIYVEIEIETSCKAYERKEIRLIQDLYSPSVELRFSQKKINTTMSKIAKNKNFTVTSKTNIPELVDGSLLYVGVIPNVNKEQLIKSELICEGEMIVNFIFSNSNNSVNSKISKIPFEISIENPIEDEKASIETKLNILNKNFDVKPNGDIECKIDAESLSEFSQNTGMNIIENIEIQQDRANGNDYDSLIIYIVQEGDTLWKIAKKFRSTVDDIARVNGIEEEDNIKIGQKLYIPKFRIYNRRNNVDAISA